MIHLGNIPASSTIYIPFATFDANGASVTITGLAVTDIEIYKNGSITQRSSDNGYTLLDTDGIDFDGITGIHGFSIDLSDNTDAGFYSAGATYWVVVSAITVNAQTVNFVAATFRIVVAENTAGTPVIDVGRISGDSVAADNAESFFDGTGYAGTNNVIPVVTLVNGLGTDVVNSTSLATSAVTEIQAGLAGASQLATAQADLDDIQTRLPAALVSGRMDSSVGAMATNVLDSNALATSAVTEIQAGLAGASQLATAQADLDDIQTRLPAALVGGRMDSSVGAMATNVLDANALAASAVTEIQTGLATSASIVTLQADTDDIQLRLPAALVGGRMDSSVGALQAGIVTAIQSGLATAAALSTAQTAITAIQAVTVKLDTGLELNAGLWRWTVAALAQAPAGGGGGNEWDELLAAHVIPNSFGAFVQALPAVAAIVAEVGPQDLVEQSARRVIDLIKGEKAGATQQAIAATKDLYATAKQSTPVFDSPKIKELMSTPAVKDAVNAARSDVEAAIPKTAVQSAKDSGLITDLSNAMFKRVKAGQPIDDLVTNVGKSESKLADNSFEILTEARRKLGQQLDSPDVSGSLKRDLSRLHGELTDEMNKLSPSFQQANAEYSAKLARVDMLKNNSQIDAIENLANGNVQQALPKILRMPPSDLKAFMGIIDDPEAFKNVARGFLRQKLDAARGSGDVASKLVAKGEWKNIATLLGDDEAAALKATIDAESKIAKSTRAVTGGSDTVPKAQAAAQLGKLSGASSEPFETMANIASGSWMSAVANSAKAVLRAFKREGNPEQINELADVLVLSAPKGIQAMEKVLKARGYEAAELRRMRPHLEEWQAAVRGAGAGTATSLIGQAAEATTKTKKKKS